MKNLKHIKLFESFEQKNDLDKYYLSLFRKTKRIGGFKDRNNDALGDKFDAIPTGLFITSIFEEYLKGSKFIDIGCGFGNIVRLAEKFGMDAAGIEIQTKYKEYHNDISVVYQNAKKFNYSNLDVIYMYRPMTKDKDMYDIISQILKTANVGTRVIYVRYDIVAPCKFKEIDRISYDIRKYNWLREYTSPLLRQMPFLQYRTRM
jgi:SAM-dependent methyltransferase